MFILEQDDRKIITIKKLNLFLVRPSDNRQEACEKFIQYLKHQGIKFIEEDIRIFLFSTRFLFQNLDRVIFFDNELSLIGDTDTLDLDPRSFSTRLDEIEFETVETEGVKVAIIPMENGRIVFV